MDYIDHAIKQLENQNTISGTFARQQYNELKASQMPTEWSKEAPTKPGVYLARSIFTEKMDFVQVAQCQRFYPGSLVVFLFGTGDEGQISGYSEWLGPFPTMDGEK